MRVLQLYAPDVHWTPMRMTFWNLDPWVSMGGIAYVLTKDYDRKALKDRHRWPRVLGSQIKDPGYDPFAWYPIPFPTYCLYPLGTTSYCEKERDAKLAKRPKRGLLI